MKRRLISLLLSLTLCLSYTPVYANEAVTEIEIATAQAEEEQTIEATTDSAAPEQAQAADQTAAPEQNQAAAQSAAPEQAQPVEQTETLEQTESEEQTEQQNASESTLDISLTDELPSMNDATRIEDVDGNFVLIYAINEKNKLTLTINGNGDMPELKLDDSIEEVEIGSGVTSISVFAFSGFTNLRKVTIPYSVKEIEWEAFKGCENLREVNYKGTKEDWDKISGGQTNSPVFRAYLFTNGIDETGTYGSNITYTLTRNADYTFDLDISGKGEIPSYQSNYSGWYKVKDYIKNIRIASGITSIANYAFNCYTGLQSVTIPKSVTSIGMQAFYSMPDFYTVFYDGTEDDWNNISIGNYNTELIQAFNASGLKKSSCGSNCEYKLTDDGRGGYILSISGTGKISSAPWVGYASRITQIEIEDGITGIGSRVFHDHTALKKISIPSSLESVEDLAFDNCSALNTVSYDGDSDYFYDISIAPTGNFALWLAFWKTYGKPGMASTVNGVTYKINLTSDNKLELEISGTGIVTRHNKWSGYDMRNYVTSIVIKDGITAIADNAFWDYEFVDSITIPTTVTTIDNRIFVDDTLKHVTYGGTAAEWNQVSIYGSNSDVREGYYITNGVTRSGPCGPKASYQLKPKNGTSYDLIITGTGAINDYISDVAPWEFSMPYISSLRIGEGITKIGNGDFAYLPKATVELPTTLKSIGDVAFENSNIQDIVIPEGVTEIGNGAFIDSEIYGITIPKTVKLIDEYAFCDTDISVVRYTGSEAEWNKIDFTDGNSCLLSAMIEFAYKDIYKAVILQNPEDYTAGIKGKASFTVVARNASSFQWQYSKDGTKWLKCSSTGYNTDTLRVTVSDSNKGNMYRCVVTGRDGKKATSGSAKVDLIPGVVIILNPQSAAVAIGDYATFTVIAENAASYQWQYSKDNAHWYNSGAEGNQTDTLTVKGAQNSQGNRYRCKITGIDGNVKKSLSATMIVMKAAPVDSYAKVGETATFSLKAEGIETYLWQYSKDGGSTWYKSGATGNGTDSISFKVTETLRSMIYRCKMTTAEGAYAFSNVVGFAQLLEIVKQPFGYTSDGTVPLTLSVEAKGVASYQWRYRSGPRATWRDIQDIYGGNTSAIELPNVSTYQNKQYQCVLTGYDGSVMTTEIVKIEVRTE